MQRLEINDNRIITYDCPLDGVAGLNVLVTGANLRCVLADISLLMGMRHSVLGRIFSRREENESSLSSIAMLAMPERLEWIPSQEYRTR